ncbi:MAG: hypothetical protein P1P83_09985 [Bacteroidales bacterium]|nr:hypothetical protein [Bacteroidales bacterium]MDT8374319.1 hypothetical protein [Bacteroidales bacterium]
MYKAWIRFTIFAALFFLICLGVFLFMNKPVLENLWQEALLIVSILNIVLAYIWYRRNRDEFAAERRKE